MAIYTPERFLVSMRRTADIYANLLADVTQERAQSARDGVDGWNVIEIMCHMRDFETIFIGRAQAIATDDHPQLIAVDHEQLVIDNAYAEQELKPVLSEFLRRRADSIAWFKARQSDEWARQGEHPYHGTITLLEAAIQMSTHDVDHLEQVVRVLYAAE